MLLTPRSGAPLTITTPSGATYHWSFVGQAIEVHPQDEVELLHFGLAEVPEAAPVEDTPTKPARKRAAKTPVAE